MRSSRAANNMQHPECRDIPHRLTVPHLQEGVGIHQKLKIGFYFCEFKALERRIRSQQSANDSLGNSRMYSEFL